MRGSLHLEAKTVELADLMAIALRYPTAMADAMVDACVERAARTGEPLFAPDRRRRGRSRGARPSEDVDWQRMVEGNRGTDAMRR